MAEQPCPRCEGAGEVTEYAPEFPAGTKTGDCPECGGLGSLALPPELSPYEEGRRAYGEGLDPCENPYKPFCADDDEYDWDCGWDDADRERLKRQMKGYEDRATAAALKNAKRVHDLIMEAAE